MDALNGVAARLAVETVGVALVCLVVYKRVAEKFITGREKREGIGEFYEESSASIVEGVTGPDVDLADSGMNGSSSDEVNLGPDSEMQQSLRPPSTGADADGVGGGGGHLAPRCIRGFRERLRDSPTEASASAEMSEKVESNARVAAVECYGGRVASGVISDALDEATDSAVTDGGEIPRRPESSEFRRMSDAESGKSGDGEEEQHGDDKSCSAFRPEQYEETIRSLEDQVTYLEESLEEMRRKLAAEREELLRERSRSAMARLEAGAQEKAWAARQAEADEEARESSECVERVLSESTRQRETFQKTLRALKASLDEKDAALSEKEDSNSVLRRDLMETVAKFGLEKVALERRLLEEEQSREEVAERLDKGTKELEEARKKSDKRGREKKRLSREVVSLRREVQDVYRNNERGIKVAKILERIDNID